MDCKSPDSSVHGVLQARILEWVAISFSRGSSQTRVQTSISWTSRQVLCCWAAREALFPRKTMWAMVSSVLVPPGDPTLREVCNHVASMLKQPIEKTPWRDWGFLLTTQTMWVSRLRGRFPSPAFRLLRRPNLFPTTSWEISNQDHTADHFSIPMR